jgi:two-component system, OmpR family, sensor histidine kinase BaeS
MTLFWRLLAISLLVVAVAVGVTALTIGRVADVVFADLMMKFHIETEGLRRLFTASLARSLLVTSLIAGGVGVLLSAVLVRAVTRPVRTMRDLARRIAGGDYAARAEVRGAAELVSLAASLNRMAASLQRLEGLRKDLVANVAHELRTPLTNLRGYLEAVHEGVTPPSPETIGMLHEEVMRLVRLVEALHDLSRLDALLPQIHRAPLDVGALAERLVALRRPEFTARRIAVRLAGAGVRVHADADLLSQALSNLLDNALKFTPPAGEVAVDVARDNGVVRLAVSNTGEDIPADDLPFIFERFYRGEKSRSRASGGAGIGLAIVQEVARAHGGQTGAASGNGRTTVWFTVPD